MTEDELKKIESDEDAKEARSRKEQDDLFWRLLKWGAFVVVCAWVIIPAIGFYLTGDFQWATAGQIGDLFGSVNSLFSGVAFAGMVIAIFLQRKELELQREELRLQRREIRRQRIVQEAIKDLETIRHNAEFIPIFRFGNPVPNMDSYATPLINGGSGFTLKKITCSSNVEVENPTPEIFLEKDGKFRLQFTLKRGAAGLYPFTFILQGITATQQSFEFPFIVKGNFDTPKPRAT